MLIIFRSFGRVLKFLPILDFEPGAKNKKNRRDEIFTFSGMNLKRRRPGRPMIGSDDDDDFSIHDACLLPSSCLIYFAISERRNGLNCQSAACFRWKFGPAYLKKKQEQTRSSPEAAHSTWHLSRFGWMNRLIIVHIFKAPNSTLSTFFTSKLIASLFQQEVGEHCAHCAHFGVDISRCDFKIIWNSSNILFPAYLSWYAWTNVNLARKMPSRLF